VYSTSPLKFSNLPDSRVVLSPETGRELFAAIGKHFQLALEGAVLTRQTSNKPGHGRKRCPEPLVEGDANGDTGPDAVNTNGGGMDTGGGWEGDNHGTSSAPADWEQTSTFAPSAPPLGSGGAW